MERLGLVLNSADSKHAPGQDQLPVDTSVRSSDGTRLTVRRLGAGIPVVLLHGSAGGLHSWQAVADQLADRYELWLVCRRGYAPSDVPAGPNSFPAEVADVHAVLDAVGAPAHLVGSSYGATLALHAAGVEGVRSLSLYEPPLFAAGPRLAPVLAAYRELLAAGDVARATLLFLREVARVPEVLLAALGGAEPDPVGAVGSLHDLEALAADDGEIGRWSEVSRPALILQGADTWEPMPATMDRLAAALPRAERVVWAGQAHFATSTAPGLVADTLRRFLADHE
jgi:pimeloyl-ACP methyl ester carboxylesterase